MKPRFILGATALVLFTTASFAETTVATKSSTSVTHADGTSVYSTTKSEESMEIDGTITEESRTYEADPDAASHSESVTKINPDGSRSTYKEKHTLSTEDGELVERRTTTESHVN